MHFRVGAYIHHRDGPTGHNAQQKQNCYNLSIYGKVRLVTGKLTQLIKSVLCTSSSRHHRISEEIIISSSQHHINNPHPVAHVQIHLPTHLIMATFLSFAAFLLVGAQPPPGYSPLSLLVSVASSKNRFVISITCSK